MVFGAICEAEALLSFMDRNSGQPLSLWQNAIGHLMLPEIAVVSACNVILEHLPPGLSGGLSQDLALLALGASLVVQAVVFSLQLSDG